MAGIDGPGSLSGIRKPQATSNTSPRNSLNGQRHSPRVEESVTFPKAQPLELNYTGALDELESLNSPSVQDILDRLNPNLSTLSKLKEKVQKIFDKAEKGIKASHISGPLKEVIKAKDKALHPNIRKNRTPPFFPQH